MSRPTLSIAQVDAFADRPFTGNPAAVCLLPAARSDAWMQAVAGEMNLAETAFLLRHGDGYDLRWFTPEVEVDLCGHATLASAHLLWERGEVPADRAIRFETRSGRLTCERSAPADGADGDDPPWIWMDFPATPAEALAAGEDGAALTAGLSAALGATPRWAGRSRFDLLVELASEAEVTGLAPDPRSLAAIETRGIIATAPSDRGGCDFVSRFFAPGVGVPEDPVTGSAHCTLAPFWSARLGRPDLVGYQASARGGTVRTELRGERVRLGGRAVTVLTGELLDDAGAAGEAGAE
jgi:predicted PhzF superfamily epimerase YddE/YHI9